MNDIFGYHKHHIVFRSQGGMDYDLNLIQLTQEEHEGNDGPHHNIERDRQLKRQLQEQLFELFPPGQYDIDTISKKLGRTRKYFEPRFCKVKNIGGLYEGEDIVRHLMGGKLY